MLIIFLSLIPCFARIDEDITSIKSISSVMDSILKITEDNYLRKVSEYLVILESDLDRTSKSVDMLESLVKSLGDHHTNFNTTHASYITNLVALMKFIVDDLDVTLHSFDTTLVRLKIPSAVTGLATADTQAKNSITKIKQESYKLEQTIASNSKFVWVWGIVILILAISIAVYYTLNKASTAAF